MGNLREIFRLLALFSTFSSALTASEESSERILEPYGSVPKTLVCFPADGDGIGGAAFAALAHLQGLLAARGGGECLYNVSNEGARAMLEIIRKDYPVSVVSDMKFDAVMETFGGLFGKYVVYDESRREGFNKIAMFAAINGALILEKSLVCRPFAAKWRRLDFEEAALSEAQFMEKYADRLNFSEAAAQNPSLTAGLRDYCVMRKIPVFWDAKIPREILRRKTGACTPMMGWGGAGGLDEGGFISLYTENGFYSSPSDHALNLSVLGKFPNREAFRQTRAEAVENAKKHLVCFIMTDGDNLAFNINDMAVNPRWGGGECSVPMTWGVNSLICEQAPAMLKYLYAKKNAHYVAMSGIGYAYPSKMPKKTLEEFARKTAFSMEKADLRILEVLDFDAFEKDAVWAEFLKYPQIDAIVYIDYYPYHKADGKVRMVNGKPVAGLRASFWEGLKSPPKLCGSSAEEIAAYVNLQPADPASEKSYSLICVHAWSKTLDDVSALAAKFSENVEVVGADVFFASIKKHLSNKSKK